MPDPPISKVRPHPAQHRSAAPRSHPAPPAIRGAYAELTVTTNFTFLTGASHPDDFIERAAELDYAAIAVTDCNSLAGVVRAHVAAKQVGLPLLIACRLTFVDVAGLSLFVYPTNRAAYGRLCSLLTMGKRRAGKGACELYLGDIEHHQADLLAVAALDPATPPEAVTALSTLRACFDEDRLSLALMRHLSATDDEIVARTVERGKTHDIPLVAVNDVHYAYPEGRLLQDVVTCIRHGCTIAEAGYRLFPNGERYLKSPEQMARLFTDFPAALRRTTQIAQRAAGFSLEQLRYDYPEEICPRGKSVMAFLTEQTWRGARARFPAGVPDKVVQLIEHELELIAELDYAPFFLTVWDIVGFARSRGILCQGRGAAANSAVCYCLGITAVDPAHVDMLFERFVSRERNEPPDIDVDFEHERREEVIQYIYNKYTRDRAGLTAVVITYRGRSAIRDVGKALGLSLDAVDLLAKRVDHWARRVFDDADGEGPETLRELGFNPDDDTIRHLVELSRAILGFPRHLSQHVGGFVITRTPLRELVPIEPAAMPDRTVIEWDKDDIESLGILKVDVLGLGMLTCIRKCFERVAAHHGQAWTLATLPKEDPRVYDMICEADTVGVFQIESRAQMTMLPRLRPRNYYDLVIEVAIVRPGPIVGKMVHPYLRRRNKEEEAFYPDDKVRRVLEKTLGVPLFQEQAMALAIVAAGFTPGEAELLRRAITAWKSDKQVAPHARKFLEGMLKNGYDRDFAEQCFERLKGFSEYGFPESHAASFALLVYASAWLKRFYPAAFAASLMNSQPMGFYAPAQIVRDAQEHGVEVRSVDVSASQWDCTLEDDGRVLRLGFRLIKGLGEQDAARIVHARQVAGPCNTPTGLWLRGVSAPALRRLAEADAFAALGLDRRHALWEIQALRGLPAALLDSAENGAPLRISDGPQALLPFAPPVDEVLRDYSSVGLSLKAHPIAFLRDALQAKKVQTARDVRDEAKTPSGRAIAVAGIVLFRQRPSTAGGMLFLTLEDETARADLMIRREVYARYRAEAHYGRILIAHGRVERQGRVVQILVQKLTDASHWLGTLQTSSRDFR